MLLVVSIYYVLLLLFINNGYCGSLEETLGQNKEVNNGVINRLLSKSIKRKLLSGADIGYPCVTYEDCADGGPYDVSCCDGTCQQTLKNWWGFACPNECKAGKTCPTGTCGTEETKLENEECLCHEQCQGYEHERKYVSICCEGICQQKQNRTSGESCSCPGHCASGCCENGKCVSKQKHWIGLYWCPAECKASWNCPIGSCIKRDIGEECLCHEQCKGYESNIGCCDGICQQKQKNWEGVYVCAAKCVAAKGCETGTCPGGRSYGESCSCRGQCLSHCCPNGKCATSPF